MKKLLNIFFFIFISFLTISSNQEGFLQNTLVLTPIGYQNIQELHVGDAVYNQYYEEKIITNTYEYLTEEYLQLNSNHITINCGAKQLFYRSIDESWIKGYDFTEKEYNSIKFICQPVCIYCLTVQDHIFQVSENNIIIHNSATAVIAPSIILSFIQLAQPILILIGATISLYYFSSHNPTKEQNDTFTYQSSPEKNYFDARYQKFCKLKQEFLSVYAAVKSIKCQFQDQYNLLSYQQIFNNNCTHTYNITAQQEANLEIEQRLQLTEIRKKILEDLENEICNIQISIGLFVNEIITRKDATVIAYGKFIEQNKNPIFQQANLSRQYSYDIAAQYYEHVLSFIMFITEIEDRNKECKLLIELFNKYQSNQIVTQTTNIIPTLAQEKINIEKSQPIIDRTKQDNEKRLQAVYKYFYGYAPMPNIAHKVTHLKQELHQKLQNNSKEKSKELSYPLIKPPQKPDQNDDEQEIPRIYVGVKYHGKTASSTKSSAPKNGQAALDFSLPISSRIRVGISENQIVILARTLLRPQGGSEWHGYVTTWDDLNKEQKEKTKTTLIENGLVNSRGKIL